MKNLSLLCVGLCIFLCPLFYSSCNEDEDELPPITMEGKNTFGCLVNGKIWLPSGRLGQSGLTAQMPSSNWIWIGADNNANNTGITLNLSDSQPIQAKTYILKNDTSFYSEYNMRIGTIICFYKYNHVLSGQVTLTKLDATRGIVSGTFEFTTYNPDCGDTIKVTNGRFDIGELIH